jgi:hypothetical protein
MWNFDKNLVNYTSTVNMDQSGESSFTSCYSIYHEYR